MKTYQDRHWSKGLPLEHCSSNPMEHDDPHVALGPWPGQGQRTHVLVCSLLWFPARGVLRGPEGLFRLNWPADQPHPGGQPLASPQGLDEKQGLKGPGNRQSSQADETNPREQGRHKECFLSKPEIHCMGHIGRVGTRLS